MAQESDSHDDPIIGKIIDGCRVDRKIGQGGMGVVYLAIHETLDQEFCLKILNPALVGAEDTVDRFFREAQACAQLNHPGIVAIQNVGQEGEYYFIRMEYIEGDTLEQMVKDAQKLEWRQAVQLCFDTAEALAHAHQKGMIHRDIKPENVMFTPKGEVKVMDFGLAKHVHSNAKVSVTGQIVGTPFFMSPEQAGGKPTDARSDIYSLGVTLYYLVTGVKPFNGKNLQEIFLKHFFYSPESPKIYAPDLPEPLCEIVRKCLKKKKKERYQSAKALARDLKAVLDDPDAALSERSPSESAIPVDDGDDLGRTVRVGGDDGDMGEATVRVGGDDGDISEATVRVGGDEDDGATVQVRPAKPRVSQPGDIQTVSFKSASMVMSGEATPYNDEDDDPTAGLDLPDVSFGPNGTPIGPGMSDTGSSQGGGGLSKKKLMAIAILVAVPLLLYAGLVAASRGRYGSLKTDFERVKASEDLADMKATADDLESFAGSFSGQISGLRGDAANMAGALRETAGNLEQEQLEAEREKERRREELEQLRLRAQQEAAAKLEGLSALSDLEELKAAKSWRPYTERLLQIEQTYREVLPDEIGALRLPVFVTSYPSGATVRAADGTTVETPGVLWVRPHQTVELTFEMEGFKSETRREEATKFLAFDASLNRLVRRTVSLGLTRVRLGPTLKEEALLPVHALQVDVGTGVAYFVGHDGFLHDVPLSGRGRTAWIPNEMDHKVGVYGDPTPTLTLVPGHVILVSSLLGQVSAHTPSNAGQRAWDCQTSSPVTSPPGYHQDGVLAVGTLSGEVVFIAENSGQELWRFNTQNRVVSAPYFFREELAVVGSTDNRLYAVNWRKQGKPLSVLDLGADVVLGPVPIGRRLLVATADGVLHVVEVDAKSGHMKVLQRTEPDLEAKVSGLVVEGSNVFFSRGKEVHGFGLVDGRLKKLWAPVRAGGQVTAACVRNGLVYVGSQDGVLHAIQQESGEVYWRHSTHTPILLPPVVYGQELFVLTQNKLVVLRAD